MRSPKPEVASNMLKYLATCAQETDFILRYPDECMETIEEEAKFLQANNESPYNLMLVVPVNDEIVGNAHITLKKRLKVMHRASVGFVIMGTRKNGIKLKNGSYLDEHIMILNIS